jgi:hypothetical protein
VCHVGGGGRGDLVRLKVYIGQNSTAPISRFLPHNRRTPPCHTHVTVHIGPTLMSARCAHCDAPTVWDDAVGSSVCTSCGSLADPSQSVLTSETSLWQPGSTTLKSLRSGNNWDLSGQGKEARDRRNAVRHLS